jgi:formate dehydrogenase (NADP+) beta subunit
VCGKVCVRPCESNCRRMLLDESICIKAIKRHIIEYEIGHGQPREIMCDAPEKDEKVAIVGAGPAGIAAAFFLCRRGYPCTLFEALPEGGGMAAVGIPDYRLPRDFLNYEIDVVRRFNVSIIYDTAVGKDISLQQLREQGFKTLFLGVGAHESKKMGVDGEEAGYRGFIPGVAFLRNLNLGKEVPLGERLVVVGGGNVAIDCVRSAKRLGFKDVRLLYRRSRAEMPADEVEIREAEEEGIVFHYLTLPTRLIAEDGAVRAVECIRMELGEPDASGRRRPMPVEGSEFIIETDVCISAIGQDSNLFLIGSEPIAVTKWGTITVDAQNMETSLAGVFSGGDCVTGPASLVEALAAGSDAALTIDRYLSGEAPELPVYRKLEKFTGAVKVFDKNETMGILGGQPRPVIECLPVEERIRSFEEVDLGLTAETAVQDADRCLRCYRVALLAL